MVFLVSFACCVAMDPSADSIVQPTVCAQYRKVPVTSWMKLFHIFPGGRENIIPWYIVLLIHICFYVWMRLILRFWGNYVGNLLVFPQYSRAWICEPRICFSTSMKSCPGIFSLTNPVIWFSVCLGRRLND